jgi:hypothetical protein
MENKNNSAQQLLSAVELINQVQSVNYLIQGVCARVKVAELSANEAEGLWMVLEWQNNVLQKAAGAIELATQERAAPARAA